jgi:hypothetical protein
MRYYLNQELKIWFIDFQLTRGMRSGLFQTAGRTDNHAFFSMAVSKIEYGNTG